jgi:Secretion system C-terminal sorting domain
MKKVYILASAMLMTSVVSAQLQKSIFDTDAPTPWTEDLKVGSHDDQINYSERAGGDVFYTNTFDNQADWTLIDLGNQGAWEYGPPTDPNLVPGWMADISSTTKTDGYYFFNGVQYVLATVDVQDISVENAVAIDCSTRPGVILELEQSFRGFNASETWIQVSPDGSTWTDFQVNSGVQSNSGTTDNILLNISAVAGSQATVYIRFNWRGNSTGGYGWIIDDLTLTEAYANDISQNSLYSDDIILRYEYTKIPQTQGTPLTVQAALTNNGYNTPTAVQSHVIVTNSSAGVELDATGGVISGALAPGDEDTITFTTTLDMSTLAPDVYTITNIIEHSVADDVTSNDTLVTMLEITDNTYSHFDPAAANLFYSNPGYNSTGAYDGFQFGVQFEIYANDDLHGIDFYVDPGNSGATNYIATSEPQTLGIYIYDATADFQNPTFVDFKEFTLDGYTPGMTTFNFHMANNSQGAVSLVAGNVYRVAVEVLSGFSLWSIGEIPDEDFSSLMFGPFGAGQSTGWFSNSVEVGMNMNFDQALTVEDPTEIQEFNVGQNYPNPFDNNSTISYTLNEGSDVLVQFTDISGKIIKTINQGNQAAGTYQIEVDATEFAAGAYFYTFTIGDKQLTKKMTVR